MASVKTRTSLGWKMIKGQVEAGGGSMKMEMWEFAGMCTYVPYSGHLCHIPYSSHFLSEKFLMGLLGQQPGFSSLEGHWREEAGRGKGRYVQNCLGIE